MKLQSHDKPVLTCVPSALLSTPQFRTGEETVLPMSSLQHLPQIIAHSRSSDSLCEIKQGNQGTWIHSFITRVATVC